MLLPGLAGRWSLVSHARFPAPALPARHATLAARAYAGRATIDARTHTGCAIRYLIRYLALPLLLLPA